MLLLLINVAGIAVMLVLPSTSTKYGNRGLARDMSLYRLDIMLDAALAFFNVALLATKSGGLEAATRGQIASLLVPVVMLVLRSKEASKGARLRILLRVRSRDSPQ